MFIDPDIKSLFKKIPPQETGAANPQDSIDPASMITDEMALRAMNRGANSVSLKNKWHISWGGELDKADFHKEAVAMSEETVQPLKIPRLQKIRTIHHQIAIMLAGGTKAVEIARTLGITPARIYTLQNDPAFLELLQAYKSSSQKDTLDAQMRALGLGTLAMEQLLDQMLDSDEPLPANLLLKISTEMLGIAGYSPQAQAKNINSNSAMPSEDQIAAIKRNERANQKGTVLLRGQSDDSSS